MIKICKKEVSPAGNRTRVFHVTGGDTHHYTTEDLEDRSQKTILNYIGYFLLNKQFNIRGLNIRCSRFLIDIFSCQNQ